LRRNCAADRAAALLPQRGGERLAAPRYAAATASHKATLSQPRRRVGAFRLENRSPINYAGQASV